MENTEPANTGILEPLNKPTSIDKPLLDPGNFLGADGLNLPAVKLERCGRNCTLVAIEWTEEQNLNFEGLDPDSQTAYITMLAEDILAGSRVIR